MRHMVLRILLLAVLSCRRTVVALVPTPPWQAPTRVSLLRATVPSEEISGTSDSKSCDPDMAAYTRGYKTVFNEISCQSCDPSVGEIPDDLVGSYYKSGPAMFSAGSLYPPKTALVKPKQRPVPDNENPERMVRHPFEGDGAILGVTFAGDGKATARYRFVRTPGLFNECKVGRKRYTGMEGTREVGPECAGGLGNFDWQLPLFRHHMLPGLNKLRKNTSNTRPIYWGKRLMSLWEGGLPFKMDAISLQTEGKSLLGGAIQKEERPFGSKMVFDSKNNRALFYAIEQGSKISEITLFEFDEKFRLVDDQAGRRSFDVPGCAVLNDMAATDNYAIFVQPPLSASLQFVVTRDPGKSLKMGDGSSILHLIPRIGSNKKQLAIPIPVDSDFLVDGNLQFVNGYEDPSTGNIIFDAIRPEIAPTGKVLPSYPWTDSLHKYCAGAGKKGLWRYIVDVKGEKVSKEQLVASDVGFPTINQDVSSQRHRYIYYTVGALDRRASPPQGIGRYDAETGKAAVWMPEEYEFCGEPMYARRRQDGGTSVEDDGYILSLLFDGRSEQSVLLIFSASGIEQGPLTRIPLGFAVPHGLFGVFTSDPEAAWSEDVIARRAKLADKIESRGSMWNEVKSDFAGLGLRLDDIDEYFPGLFD